MIDSAIDSLTQIDHKTAELLFHHLRSSLKVNIQINMKERSSKIQVAHIFSYM